ncbi:MAG: tyrosine/phenylalanine carboxypeptidase domain-containing protein, partial [Polyangiaceae bacterium]
RQLATMPFLSEMVSETRWTARIDEALSRAVSQIQLLAALTPANAIAERARLVACAERGLRLVPAWTYEPASTGDALPLLDATLRALDTLGKGALVDVYRERAEELVLEAELVHAAGTPAVSTLAAKRFAPHSATSAKAAEDLATAWAREAAEERGARVVSDSDHPRSLLSMLKREVGRRALPFRVVLHPSLSSLAATGDGVILVTSGREISEEATLRTTLHEIEGHALPRTRAQKQTLGIFRIGTARGVDEQEGLALVIEERAGFLVGARRRDLALRTKAVVAMRGGADFGDVASLLIAEHTAPPEEAIVIAERIFRGSDGKRSGLGRESVYLESFVTIAETLKNKPDREIVLASGQVSAAAAGVLAPYCVRA